MDKFKSALRRQSQCLVITERVIGRERFGNVRFILMRFITRNSRLDQLQPPVATTRAIANELIQNIYKSDVSTSRFTRQPFWKYKPNIL